MSTIPHGRTKQPQSHTSSGFTLIELLVVISIIALLISILLPALSGARQAAQNVQCLNKEKQILMAVHTYSQDYNNFMPSSDAAYWGPGWDTTLITEKYIDGGGGTYPSYDGDTFRCPSQTVKTNWGQARTYVGTRGHWLYMCGWNNGNTRTARDSDIARPTEFIFLSEVEAANNYAGYSGASSTDAGYTASPHRFPNETDNYMGNYGFFDGHAGRLDYAEASDLGRWSRSGIWENLSGFWQ
jgi:prepilin-type N-terminal cleavage/methylation domain-containing protein/prepilin-type processing-associated H-X9-DG protein